jgi:hypothetical protein
MIPAFMLLLGLGAADGPDPPRVGELPAVRPVAPQLPPTDEPRPLSDNRFRLFWVESYAGSIPPRWTATSLDSSASLELIDLPTGAPAVGVLEGESRAKAHFAPSAAKHVVAAWGVSPGRVLLRADGVQDGRIVTLVSVVVAVGPSTSPPPPVNPPPPRPSSLYFLLVRPNGPATPEFVAVLSNPAWDELRKAGHAVKDRTLDELGPLYRIPSGTTLPCVVTLSVAADGRSTVVRGPVDLPTTSDAIRRLAEVRP